MKGKSRLLVVGLVVVVIASLVVGGCGPGGAPAATSVEVPLGEVLFITGPYASLGINLQRITEMTIEDINKNGFPVAGKTARLKPIVGDSAMDPAKGAVITRKHVFEDKVKFEYVVASGVVGAAQPITEASGVLLLAGSFEARYFGKDKPLTFSNLGGMHEAVVGLMMYVQKQYPNAKKVWIESGDQEATRDATENAWKPTLNYMGYTTQAAEYYPLSTTDFYGIIDRILAAKPDIVIGSVAGPALAFVKQLRERGYKGLFISPTGMPPANFVTAIGGNEAAKGIIATGINEKAAILTPEVRDFVSRYEKKHGEPPLGTLMYILDMYTALTQAISKAGTYDDPKKVAEVMGTSEFKGPFGTVKYGGAAIYGRNAMASPPVFVNTFEDGKYVTKDIVGIVPVQDMVTKILAGAKK